MVFVTACQNLATFSFWQLTSTTTSEKKSSLLECEVCLWFRSVPGHLLSSHTELLFCLDAHFHSVWYHTLYITFENPFFMVKGANFLSPMASVTIFEGLAFLCERNILFRLSNRFGLLQICEHLLSLLHKSKMPSCGCISTYTVEI